MKRIFEIIRQVPKFAAEWLDSYLDDIFIFGGLACIVGATFLLSGIAGMYVLGFCLLLLGIFVATHPSEGR